MGDEAIDAGLARSQQIERCAQVLWRDRGLVRDAHPRRVEAGEGDSLLSPAPTTLPVLRDTAGRYARVVTRCHAMRMAEP